VFLDSDNNVKLGDFGLSKIIQSHDFASTYVGTPYYMSPEICGAERYSVSSDIWSLGCLIYELCTQNPPFVAANHTQLYAKIKKGHFAPLPPQYSAELTKVVASCLQVNYNARPTAADLLALPIIRVVRKQQEAVQLHKELQKSLAEVERAKKAIRHEIDDTLRKEWEVRARLEIERVVAEEKQRLNRIFEAEVSKRVTSWIQEQATKQSRRSSDRSLGGKTAVDGLSELESSGSSGNRSLSGDDNQSLLRRGLDRLSLESPTVTSAAAPCRPSRTPLTRAQTVMAMPNPVASPIDVLMAEPCRPSRTPLTRAHTVMAMTNPVASPIDVLMADPSPMSIASLALSPRKESASSTAKAMSNNIFALGRALAGSAMCKAVFNSDDDSDDGAGDGTDGDEGNKRTCSDSPTCEPSKKMRRRTSVAPGTKRLASAPTLAPAAGATAVAGATTRRPASAVPVVAASPTRARKAAGAEMTSPSRARAPKASAASNVAESGSPARKPPGGGGLRSKKGCLDAAGAAGKAAMRGGHVQPAGGVHGRTLIELAQARAGGVDRSMASPVKATMWDPERDEMPSPFLARGRGR
jgi:NIMA (never in mitosis gene a)-related kinase